MTLFYFEWPEFDIFLDCWFVELSSDKSFSIKDGVGWVSGNLIFSGISDQSFVISEGDIRWGCVISLIIWDNFNSIVFPDTDTRVGCSEINTNSWSSYF
jgi:hypothetical protein